MSSGIRFEFDPQLPGYVAVMPPYVTLPMIDDLRRKVTAAFAAPAGHGLLVDTNRHEFESIECLKALRATLGDIADHCRAVAFVQPAAYREPHIASPREGYFASFAEAHAWLADGP